MSIENVTPASGTVFPAKQTQFFGPNSVSNISSTFTVSTEPFYIFGYGLAGGDTITVEQVTGAGSGTSFQNWEPLFGQLVQINSSQSCVRVDWPGQYRLIFSGVAVNAVIVMGYAAAFGAQTVYAVGGGGGGGGFALTANDTNSIDLTYTGNTSAGTLAAASKISPDGGNIISVHSNGLYATAVSSVTITGTPPVVVTGSGPYNISVVAASAVQWIGNASAPGTDLISMDTLSGTVVVNAPDQLVILGTGAPQGTHIVSIGYQAGDSVLGDGAIYIGNEAALSTVGAGFAEGIAIGDGVLNGATVTAGGGGEIFIGTSAGDGSTFVNVVAIGDTAAANLNATQVVAVGPSAASSQGSGGLSTYTNVVAVGLAALELSTGGHTITNAVAIGTNALHGNTSADTSTAVGNSAGDSATQAGMFIGNLAGKSETHANTIIIGPSVDGTTPLNATADNDVILGNSSHVTLRTCGSIIAGGAISASDSRLKKDVGPLTMALNRINQSRLISFDWDETRLNDSGLPHLKKDLLKRQAGVIAQEIESVFPNCVQDVAGTDGELYKFVHYDRLVPYLMSAIQELSSRLAAVEKKNG